MTAGLTTTGTEIPKAPGQTRLVLKLQPLEPLQVLLGGETVTITCLKDSGRRTKVTIDAHPSVVLRRPLHPCHSGGQPDQPEAAGRNPAA